MTFSPSPVLRASAVGTVLVALTLAAAGCASTPEVSESTTLAAAQSSVATISAVAAVSAVGEVAALAIAGRQERDAARLVEAAERMLDIRSRERLLPGQSGDPEGPGSLDPAALLLEAEATGTVDAALAERIAAVRGRLPDPTLEAPGRGGGAERGPQRYSASVAGRANRRHELSFDGPAPAVIQVRGSGATNLDVYHFDVNGDRVAAEGGPSDVATVHLYVPFTQTLTLVVRNRGNRSNAYYVITN